jgi:hypothetical protein
MIKKKGGGNREGGGAFTSNTIIKELKISVEQDRRVKTLNIIKL